jgi:hypothetical protein
MSSPTWSKVLFEQRAITIAWIHDNNPPPTADRLDVAGGLTPGLSEPGNKESTGNRTV